MNENEVYLLSTLLGQTVPPLTDVINKHVPSAKVRFLSSMLVSSIIAIALNFQRLRFGSVEEALLSGLIVFSSGQAAYKLYYENSSYQNNLRYSTNSFPLKDLIPPTPKLSSLLPRR